MRIEADIADSQVPTATERHARALRGNALRIVFVNGNSNPQGEL